MGRSKCSISLDYSCLSKKHCSIIFNSEDYIWEINDGFDNRPSTNGLWMALKTKYEINDKTLLKIGSNTLKINMV